MHDNTVFDPDIQGHGAIRERLFFRLASGKLSGSLLFTGPEGIGKRRVAMELASRELCFGRNACGKCEGCKLFKQETLGVEFPNLLRIAPEGKAGVIKIGAIREDDLVEGGVIRWAYQSPLPGTHRWILVEDAHRLNGASANMLLKTLEEPPPGTHFLLVTHRPESVLQTIRSRCERIVFKPLGEQEVWAIAQKGGWSLDEHERWTALSAGTLRYLDAADYQRAVAQVEAWVSILNGGGFSEGLGELLPDKNLEKAQSQQLSNCLELLLQVLCDIARLKEGRPIVLSPWRSSLQSAAAKPLDLKAILDVVHEKLQHLRRNPYAESLLMEVAWALVSVQGEATHALLPGRAG